MKNLKKLNRGNLKAINGGAVCNENCPPGPYGPGPSFPRSCEAYNALPKCCQSKVLVHMDCVDGGLS
ncbi:bacteriocin-like protein [Chryseobacterium scophthalmum]|uniref:bacteriocin-like protein n=1 Tax=Chryseobacterium TaxID=59732 RepID=UPI00247E8C97|nr:hypothetical protein [Chryseobacterium sp. JUb44]MDH6208737.1 hypothetical protein [Chryseobacterium sp. BIGb0186]WSO11608.1 hypothetical protein VUJ64_06820 [Chryseobacterium scophthalmum]